MQLWIKGPEKGESAGSLWPAALICAFVSFGGILFGYDLGTISGILSMEYWINEMATETNADGEKYVTSAQTALIVSILSAGTFCGSLIAGPVGDFFGRRWGLIHSCTLFSIGAIIQTISTNIPGFICGRVIAGVGMGSVSALVPLYQSECAPKWIRGSLVGSYQLCINVGLVFAASVEYATANRNDSGSYRIPCAVQILWALIITCGMLYLPETPRYLMKNSKDDRAAKSMSRLRALPVDHPQVVSELDEISANLEYELTLAKGSYLDCFRGNIAKRQLTGCFLQAFQQLTGSKSHPDLKLLQDPLTQIALVIFIFYYGTRFFGSVGFSNPFMITIITTTVATFSTIPGLYLVETMGRRNTLIMGALGMAVTQYVAAIIGVVSRSQQANVALLVFVMFYICFFQSSWGPCAWVITGEIFPLHTRSKSLAMTTATQWLFNWAISFATPYLVDPGPGNANLGTKVFFLWGSCCIFGAFFAYFCVYETKGLTLEQVDELYSTVSRAWKSPGFTPTVSFAEMRATTGFEQVASTGLRKVSLAQGSVVEVENEKIC